MKNKSFSVLTALCLICSFASFFYLQGKAYNDFKHSVQRMAETKTFYVSSENSNTMKQIYSDLANDPVLADFAIATISAKEYSGIDWRTDDNQQWHVPYGRFFSQEELAFGANAVLLSMSYIRQLSQTEIERLWDTEIEIEGKKLRPIGNYEGWMGGIENHGDFQSDALPTAVTLPLKTYLRMDLPVNHLRVVFKQDVTEFQRLKLEKIIASYEQIKTFTLPKATNEYASRGYTAATFQFLLVLVLSLLSIVSLILYWTHAEYGRYKVYLLCGARRWHILFFLSMDVLILVTISYFSALLITLGLIAVTPPGLVSLLPCKIYFYIYAMIISFLLLLVNAMVLPAIFSKRVIQ